MIIRLLLLCLLMNWCPLYAQSVPNSQQLSESELRQILDQLLGYKSCRKEVKAYELYVQREIELVAREKVNYERSLELEKQATAQAKEEAEFYKQAYKTITKGPGFGCILKRVFTLGIARCR